MASALLQTRHAHAQAPVEPPLPVVIDLTTVDACPADRFRTALEARVRRPFEVRAEGTATLRVTIANAGDGALQGTASFKGASGDATRSVRGSCDETTAALALVAATWLEAEPSVAPEALAVPTPVPSVSAVPTAPPPSPAPPAPSPPPPPPARRRLSIGAHGVGTFGLVGRPAGGAALSLAYETDRLELRAGIRGALSAETVPSGEARYAWLTTAVDGCAHALAGRALRVAGCVRVEPGYFHVSFAGDRSLPWLSAAAVARLGVSVGPVRLELETFASLPVTGYRITRESDNLVPFRALAPGLAAGIMVPFW
ncbi:hypothetical protein BH11MYX4_BH11MYX4_42430 [soil metagenome]